MSEYLYIVTIQVRDDIKSIIIVVRKFLIIFIMTQNSTYMVKDI